MLPIRLSIAAPAYNESAGIEPLIRHWHEFLRAQSDIADFEIIICNDGSTDQTASILNRLSEEYATLRPLHFKHNQGAAAALAEAIAGTQFEWVLLIDTDNQFPIENVLTMIENLVQFKVQAVLGIRNKKDQLFPRLGSRASSFLCNWAHGSRLQDFNSALKLVSGPILRSLALEAKGMNYSTEITSRLLEARVSLREVAIVHQARVEGQSHLKWFKDSIHRFLFVTYLAFRQLLFKWNVLRPMDRNEDLS